MNLTSKFKDDFTAYGGLILNYMTDTKKRTALESWGDLADKNIIAEKEVKKSALDIQIDGNHYKDMKIQVVEYNMANGIPYMEGNVIKYVSRWRAKGGVSDLKKARHYLDLLIENEEKPF